MERRKIMRHYFKLSVILFLAFHFSMCKAQKYCDCCGEYIYKKKSDGENIIWTIRLSADSSYSFLCNSPVLLLSEKRILCETSCGKWSRRNDTLLFEQYSPIYIKKEDTCKITNDSIHIKIIRKSNGLPHKNYELSCWYAEGEMLRKTDDNGEITISAKTLYVTSSDNEQYKIKSMSVSELETGCCYIFYECDCYYSSFLSNANTIILKGKNKIVVYSYYKKNNMKKRIMIEKFKKIKQKFNK